MATTGPVHTRRRHRRLPAPLFRAHRPRHRRPRKSTGRPRAPGACPRLGSAQTPGLLPSRMVHRVPRHRSCRYHQRRPRRKQRENRRRTGSLRMSEPSRSVARTAAALATRRRNTQAALGRVRDTIARLRREKAPITVAVVARRAGVSRTFLYTNPDAKTAVAEAIRQTGNQQHRLAVETDNARKSTWRERALNAEDALKTAHTDFCFNATAFANCSARSATWKPNGHAMSSSESPPRTPLLNSGSVSPSPTIARSTNDSKPPAPTCASKTVESPTSKPDRLSLRIPLRARAAHDHWQGQTSCLAAQVNTWWKNRDTSTTQSRTSLGGLTTVGNPGGGGPPTQSGSH